MTFVLPYRFGTGTAPDNQFPPKVGADFDALVAFINSGGGGGGGSYVAISPSTYGAFADGGSHPITLADIAAHPNWIGPYNQSPLTTYPVGTEWDVVGIQEAIYACFAQTSTPGNVVWNTNDNLKNTKLVLGPGHYIINRQIWCSASGWNISADNKLGTKLKWQGYTALNQSDFNSYFTCNSHTSTTLDGISADDIAQLHVGMNVRQIVNTQDTGGIPWNTQIDTIDVGAGSVTITNAAKVTTTGMKVFVWLDMLHMDSTSYGAMNQVALQADAMIPRVTTSGGGTAALMTIDNTVPFSSLSPQFLSFYDCSFFGNQYSDVGVSIVPIAGGSGQGSNIQFLNCDISSCWRAGLRIAGSNALNVNWYNGDMQNCRYDGISGQAFGGQILGCSFENQINFNTVPLQNQFTNMGRDILANGVGGSIGNAVDVQNVRSEGQVGVICNNGGPPSVKFYGITNSNIEDWVGGSTWFPGEPIIPSMNNVKGRAFICVESGGENIWRTLDPVASSGDVVVFNPSPGWSPNQWITNYNFAFQFGNTFPAQWGPITSSNANSITIAGSGAGDNVNGETFPIGIILKINGSVAPNFDSLAGATFVQAGSTDQGFYPHAGTQTVGVGSGDAPNISVGTGIMVRDTILIGCFSGFTPQFPYALTSLVTATGPGTPDTDLTVTQNVIFGQGANPVVPGTPGRDGYYGDVLDDNGIKWMELPYSGHEGCQPLVNCEGGNGYLRSCSGIINSGTARLDGPGLADSNATPFGNATSTSSYQNGIISYQQGPTWIRPLQFGISSGTIDMTSRIRTADHWEHTPTGNTTYNFPDYSPTALGGIALYREFTLIILTSGTTSFTLTFGTNTATAGTLATGATDSKYFVIKFFYDANKWIETSRIGPL